MSNSNRYRRAPKPVAIRFTLADRLLATGQRLRTDQAITATTFALTYAAKWAQGVGR